MLYVCPYSYILPCCLGCLHLVDFCQSQLSREVFTTILLDFRLMNSKERIYGAINCVQNFYAWKWNFVSELELRPILTFDGKMTLVNSWIRLSCKYFYICHFVKTQYMLCLKTLYYTILRVINSWQEIVNLKTRYERATLKYLPKLKIIKEVWLYPQKTLYACG